MTITFNPPSQRQSTADTVWPPSAEPDPLNLVPGFPVTPLGHSNGTFHFLSARGELTSLGPSALALRANLVALFAGAQNADKWLAWIGPCERRDMVFNPILASDFLVTACAHLPLFDARLQIRRCGTWRGPKNCTIAHLGDRLVIDGCTEQPAGAYLERSVYAAGPRVPLEAAQTCEAGDLRGIRDQIRELWSWDRPCDADILMGWIAQAVLGQYPRWRVHLWLNGQRGSGKTTLVEILNALAAGMSPVLYNEASEAAVRQATNEMAIIRMFDEAEAGAEVGHVDAVLRLVRLMSDASGASVERGSASGSSAQSFRLHGAALFASIIPAVMRPQDRSRFVMLTINGGGEVEDPLETARRLADLQESAKFYGPYLWRRMLALAPKRWDAAERQYAALVQSLGGDRRAADTIGATLAGWDLALFDDPLESQRLGLAEPIARALLKDVEISETESEGQRCLRHILGSLIPRDVGGTVSVTELVRALQGDETGTDKGDTQLLARCGLRMLGDEPGARELFVPNGSHPQLDRIFSGTHWRQGGHRAALQTLEGVQPSANSVSVAGTKSRGIMIPARHLPIPER